MTKSKIPKKDLIKVILVNNSPLAIKGWKSILSKAADIDVVYDTTPSSFLDTANEYKTADIILADLSLINALPYKRKMIEQIKKTGYRCKIIIILNDKRKVSHIKKIGANETLITPIRGEDLISLIRGLHKDNKSRCEFYANSLRNFSIKQRQSNEYENMLRNIFQSLFFPNLVETQFNYYYNNREKFCLVFYKTKQTHPFWDSLFSEYNLKKLLFLIQNTNDSHHNAFSFINSQLSGISEKFGVLVVRRFEKTQLKQIQSAMFQNEKKAILVLEDEDIINLLSHSAAGVDPIEALEDIYNKFLLSLLNYSS